MGLYLSGRMFTALMVGLTIDKRQIPSQYPEVRIAELDSYPQIKPGEAVLERSHPGMAYRLNLADIRLPIFDQSRLPKTIYYRF